MVVTHTGNEKHTIVVGVLALPTDESLWSPKLRLYFHATEQFHARPKETELGELMVTNLSSFPSALTVIALPDGDVRKHRPSFFLNEDLKRLGCSGRSGLTLTDPTEATRAKFYQLYKTSDRIPFAQSVTELVKLCQVALYMFDKLGQEYIDGLLCDVTEAAINSWWAEVGAEHYNFEPSDGILGPTTVAALLGMFMGARNRLNWHGAPVSKDVFDIESTKRGIWYFQKAQKLEKTRRLDRQTLFRLHTATAKAAAGEGWGVQKAVKSTVTEIGGKRGEIVLDMVSGKDKAGLADIETLDIDQFAGLAYGDIPRWLWQGKPRRTPFDYLDLDHEETPVSAKPVETTAQSRRRAISQSGDEHPEHGTSQPSTTYYIDKDGTRRAVFRSVAGRMSDAKSGLGRIKDTIGGSRRHYRGPSWSAREGLGDSVGQLTESPQIQSVNTGPAAIGRTFTWKNKPEEYLEAINRSQTDQPAPMGEIAEGHATKTFPQYEFRGDAVLGKPFQSRDTDDYKHATHEIDPYSRTPSVSRSEADTDPGKLTWSAPRREVPQSSSKLLFSRRRSCDLTELYATQSVNETRWARRMSFSDAEEAILDWTEIADIDDHDPENAAARIAMYARLTGKIENIIYAVEPWVEKKIKQVARLDQVYSGEANELQTLAQQLRDACEQVRASSDDMLEDERMGVTESIKGIELLIARLDYEMNALVAKVNDVEDGIRNFELQVEDVEKRAEELKLQLETESWLHWMVRTLTGIGTGPNITRSG